MHQSLRPELRGAQRFLRSSIPLRISRPHRISVIRSFSSYIRLQEQPSTSSSPVPPRKPGGFPPRPARDSVFKLASEFLSRSAPGDKHEDEQDADKRYPKEKDADILRAAGDGLGREAAILESIDRGEIPQGYRIAHSPADLPRDFEPFKNGPEPEFPIVYTEDPSKPFPIIPLPSDFSSPRYPDQLDNNASEAADANLSSSQNNGRSPRHHAMSHRGRRRKRFRVQEHDDSVRLPSWFLSNNIIRSQQEQSKGNSGVVMQQLEAATHASGTEELVQIPKSVTREARTQSLLQVHGNPEEPNSEEGTSDSPRPPTEHLDAPQRQVSLSHGRYFIDQHQYRELLSTFKGRLQRASNASPPNDGKSAFSMDHLTILHGAKDADLLLDALVQDMCQSVGANRVRLDVQDISELIADSDVDHPTAQKAAKMSYRVYRNIYGQLGRRQETNTSREEDEEEEDEEDEEEDDDDVSPRASFDIPISSVVAFPLPRGGGKSSLGNVQRGSPLSSLFGGGPGDLLNSYSKLGSPMDNPEDTIKKLADSILTASIEAQSPGPSDSPQDNAEKEGPHSSQRRPLVVHLPTYRDLQDHELGTQLMGALIDAADRRSIDGQSVIVIGTDCMRNLDFLEGKHLRRFGNFLRAPVSPSQPIPSPHVILDEQEEKSWGASTAIVLTPVFPDENAEKNLLQDRETKIRDINARHLFRAVKRRGLHLKGLEEGFWSRDYTAELGGDDCKTLSEGFWPFVHVQRLSAMIAGSGQSQAPITEASKTITLSDESKVAWARKVQPVAAKDEKEADTKVLRQIRGKATSHEKKLLSGVIEPKKITTTFGDIHIPPETVEALQTLTTLSLVRPEAFKYGVLKSDRIPGLLLYGPPGTGKTLAAKAVAKESGATVLEVSGADLNDMYVGEGEKNVKALFSLAKKLSPCVVFIDEADAMFSARSTGSRKVAHRELLNQFLKEWDGMSNDAGSAFIMVATNRPMDLDDAVLRRLPRRLLVDLPAEEDRHKILQIHLRNEHLDGGVDLKDLAKKTPFYSGSDLKNVAVAAALQAVREENEAAKKWRAENPDSDTPYQYPEKRTLTQSHFDKALQEISASISEDMSSLREIKKFDEQYGDRKGRKRRMPRWGFKSAAEADKSLDTVKVRS